MKSTPQIPINRIIIRRWMGMGLIPARRTIHRLGQFVPINIQDADLQRLCAAALRHRKFKQGKGHR